MKITQSVLTRLHTGSGIQIGGKYVPRYALTRGRGVAITGQALKVQRAYTVADSSGHGVAIP